MRCDRLDCRHDRADFARVEVIRRHGGVGPVPFGFRRERIDEQAAQEAADRGRHWNQPDSPWTEVRRRRYHPGCWVGVAGESD